MSETRTSCRWCVGAQWNECQLYRLVRVQGERNEIRNRERCVQRRCRVVSICYEPESSVILSKRSIRVAYAKISRGRTRGRVGRTGCRTAGRVAVPVQERRSYVRSSVDVELTAADKRGRRVRRR